MADSSNAFLGMGWAFPPAFEIDSKWVEMVSAEKDIQQSIRIILGTIPTERVMDPKFGCDILSYVFETNDPTYLTLLRDAISDALLYYEPRIKVHDIFFGKEKLLEGILHIHIEYTVIITNSRSNMVYPFYFKEGTNL
ncbi:GPW/gp25 family protein [Algoriphagus aestuariicola]|jgi:phage baseplate assembly protein W|uniref:GPW/gp25 family protein n=1 Tax=Algoriphagus aestuariicola TaxID=1852016 RepID=A0ABS3BKY7_9BACT|nr:GPW/gp25 family protein [Algoriphagus aestuariicola]MBN7799838.1 GPW/gp25 family protein [Algoriphagus aestuariicola]